MPVRVAGVVEQFGGLSARLRLDNTVNFCLAFTHHSKLGILESALDRLSTAMPMTTAEPATTTTDSPQ